LLKAHAHTLAAHSATSGTPTAPRAYAPAGWTARELTLLVFPNLRKFFCRLRGFFCQLGSLFLHAGTPLFYVRALVEILPALAENLTGHLLLPELLHLADYFAHLFPVVCAIGPCKLIQPLAEVLLHGPSFGRCHRRSGPASAFHSHWRFRLGLVAALGPFSSAGLDVASFNWFAHCRLSFSRPGWVAQSAFAGSIRVSFLGDEALHTYQQNHHRDNQSDFLAHLFASYKRYGYLSGYISF
jgi:hypothetical protein